jgi:two-component system, NtrC family, sensor histidine kinase HydH
MIQNMWKQDEEVREPKPLTRMVVVAAGIAAASALHYFTSPSLILWHNLFQRLYYLPIIYAAIYFGWRGGLVASTASAVCYIPHILMAWHHMLDYAMNQYAEIIVFFLVGTVTGVLADRGMKQRRELAALNRELQDSFEQIKRADRLSAIGQLSASLAHEIRNPLASIDGATNLIESEQTPQEMRKASLAIIRKEVQRLNRLLTNLLDFARPRKPEFQAAHADRLIDAIIALAGHSAQQKGIGLHKDVPASVPAFECDPEQMKQVILNLAINAVQAMTGTGEIVLAARQVDSSVVISVRDQGPGISDEDLDKIFNPFYTTKDAGTGLGLSVVYQIVNQHGGLVTAERNPEGGMTFSLTIPLNQRRDVDQEAHSGSR